MCALAAAAAALVFQRGLLAQLLRHIMSSSSALSTALADSGLSLAAPAAAMAPLPTGQKRYNLIVGNFDNWNTDSAFTEFCNFMNDYASAPAAAQGFKASPRIICRDSIVNL